MRTPSYCLSLLAGLILTSPSTQAQDPNCQQLLTQIQNLPQSTAQIVIVKPVTKIEADIILCQRQEKHWEQVLPAFRGVVGGAGVASIGEKREGDMKTPTGLYSLGDAFGWEPLALKMDYKYITVEDKYIDDVNSKDYNTWVTGKTEAKSYESMLIPVYKLGVVVNYNKEPVVPGAGSAIFMHIWKSATAPTAGCIATDEHHLLATLHWLDKKQHPFIFIDFNH